MLLKNSNSKNCNVIKKTLLRFFTLMIMLTVVNLPLVSAVSFSSVSVNNITSSSVDINWETNESSDSKVYYGVNSSNLDSYTYDSTEVSTHNLEITGLNSETNYIYYVESNGDQENNSDSYYSFTTLVSEVSEEESSDETENDDGTEEDSTSDDSIEGLFVDADINDNIAGEVFSFTGESVSGAEVRVYINGGYFSKKTVSSDGTFSFSNVPLNANQNNLISLEATTDDEEAIFQKNVYSDTEFPEITIDYYEEFIDSDSFSLSGTISENVSIQISGEGREFYTGSGTSFSINISLEEGENIILIEVIDQAGWTRDEEVIVTSDTEPPEVDAEFEKGNEYYQNRAETNIHGITEPGAEVYLYVYRPLGYEYTPEFDDARATIVADENGNFTFEDVNFETEPISLEDFSPEEVPSDLLEFSVYPMDSVEQAQKWTYHVFIIAEDKTGKTGYWREDVIVNTCYSSNFDFQISSLSEFQRPLRLDPGLLDDGREEAHAVFDIEYRGSGYSSSDALGSDSSSAYKINSVKFQKACTQSMLEDEKFALGCGLIGNEPNDVLENPDKTTYYLGWSLNSAEKFSEKEEDYWNEFKKRMIVFPLKITVNYQEYESDGSLGESKTQSSCYDLSYFIDVPLDSQELIPDWLANEGMEVLNKTITAIDKVLPYLEKAVLITGISCFVSIGVKTVIRMMRMFSSRMEYMADRISSKDKDEQCPSTVEQYNLYLDSTIDHWKELYKSNDCVNEVGCDNSPIENNALPTKEDLEDAKNSLTTRCASTAGLWKVEAALDQFYRWTCDRFLCRGVPAKWTDDKDNDKIQSVYLKQRGCAVTAGCTPLKKIEECDEYVKNNRAELQILDSTFKNRAEPECWESIQTEPITSGMASNTIARGTLYYLKDDADINQDTGVVKLYRVGSPIFDASFGSGNTILAYQEPGSDSYCGAQTRTCQQVCSDKGGTGYKAVTDGYKLDSESLTVSSSTNGAALSSLFTSQYLSTMSGDNVLIDEEISTLQKANVEGKYDRAIQELKNLKSSDSSPATGSAISTSTSNSASGGPCYKQENGILKDPEGNQLGSKDNGQNKYSAGFTKDCFIGADFSKYQCVCEGDASRTQSYGARVAAKNEGEPEKFIYRQDRLFKESLRSKGTFYPDWRYYAGRDASGAFGANYLTDYLRPGNEKFPEVNPQTQYLSTWQTFCLSGILNQLTLLRSILQGLYGCIEEAKYTGFQDAGMCKTLFAQHVCGILYKFIASAQNKCSPINIEAVDNKKGFALIGEGFEAASDSIIGAMDTQMDDLTDDYGNAKLNEYFAGGVQGVAQSMCLAAFGFDWPIGYDFIMDAAYAVPMKTTALVFPASREFSHFDPSSVTAVYNYEIGAAIFPGCKVARYDVYLKCVGQSDLAYPGVSCTTENCDCLNSQGQSPYETEREILLPGGSGTDLQPGAMIDLPIESPQKINKHFRYDHVVIKMRLDSGYESKNCFDSGYKLDDDQGIFYYPIKDASGPGLLSCNVEPTTGQFNCPELSSVFYGDEFAFLESPYIACYDQSTNTYVDCDTPNLFTLSNSNEVKFQIYTSVDDQGYCLDISASGTGVNFNTMVQIPSGVAGQRQIPVSLGPVSSVMFGSTDLGLKRMSGSDNNCPTFLDGISTGSITNGAKVKFHFEQNIDGYKVKEELDHSTFKLLTTTGYSLSADNELYSSSSGSGSSTDINSLTNINLVEFGVGGVKFSGILGTSITNSIGSCAYEVQTESSGSSTNDKKIRVTTKLLKKTSSGSCYNAKDPVQAISSFGRSSAQETIIVQKESVLEQATNLMHQFFLEGKSDQCIELASELITYGPGDVDEARGIYYYVLCLTKDAGSSWVSLVGENVKTLLNRFFLRKDSNDYYLLDFDEASKSSGEFKKVRKYLCLYADKLGVGSDYSSVSYGCSSSGGSTNLCSITDYPIDGVTLSDPGDAVYAYGCVSSTHAKSCKKSTGSVVSSNFEITSGHDLITSCSGI